MLFFLEMLDSLNQFPLKDKIGTIINLTGKNTIWFHNFGINKIDMLVIVLWTWILIVFIVACWIFIVAQVSFYFRFAEGGDRFFCITFCKVVMACITWCSLPGLKTWLLLLSEITHIDKSIDLDRSRVAKLVFVQVSIHFTLSQLASLLLEKIYFLVVEGFGVVVGFLFADCCQTWHLRTKAGHR